MNIDGQNVWIRAEDASVSGENNVDFALQIKQSGVLVIQSE